MNILCIGDVVGSSGCRFLREHLSALKKLKGIDLVIVNGENSADGNGITPDSAEFLFTSGADVITTGNHCFQRSEIYDLMDREEYLLRPANYSGRTPGHGFCIVDKGRIQIGVINLMGTMYLENLENPFDCVDRILKEAEMPSITLLDFHAETTSEKRAMGFYLDGRISALFGTHTHVQTSDLQILPGGTGYITDLGMTGPGDSVIGVDPEIAIRKFRTNMPARFHFAKGPCSIEGAIFAIDEKSGKTVSCEAIRIK